MLTDRYFEDLNVQEWRPTPKLLSVDKVIIYIDPFTDKLEDLTKFGDYIEVMDMLINDLALESEPYVEATYDEKMNYVTDRLFEYSKREVMQAADECEGWPEKFGYAKHIDD
jgi:hypothetical protein